METKDYPKVWSFKNPDIVKNFDKHARASIPMYDEIQRMVAEIAQFFVRENDTVIDLGCSTGTTMKTIDESVGKDFKIIGIDDSEDMIKNVKKNIHLSIDTTFIEHDLNEELILKIRKNVSLVVALYTLQFIKLENRQQLINHIYDYLRKDGAFLLVEKIEGNNARFNEMMTEFYNDMKIRNGLTPGENIKKSRSLRGVMCPITLADNTDMLEEAGFTKIDVVFKWYNFVGILAIK